MGVLQVYNGNHFLLPAIVYLQPGYPLQVLAIALLRAAVAVGFALLSFTQKRCR